MAAFGGFGAATAEQLDGVFITPPSSVVGDCGAVPLCYDFEDQHTKAQLELIDDLQKLGVSKYLNLPQLVVVGDQSTGKSSVLRAVTDIPFTFADNMCTRFATEIILQRTSPNHPTEIEVCIKPDADATPERKEELMAWRPIGFDRTATLDKTMMEDIFKQADDIIFGNMPRRSPPRHSRHFNRLSSSILKIIRRGPEEKNFAIVDVPGLVRRDETNSEHQTAKKLVQHYLNNPRSIVMAVIDVVDLERQEIMNMIRHLPDSESRVIGVINKCDTKLVKSHDWVFDLILNDPAKSPFYLKEGWFGLRNRQPAEINASDRERDKKEEEFFSAPEWNLLSRSTLGRHNLKAALIKMRNRHVKRSIPELVSEIQTKLDKCLIDIDQLGPPRTSNHSQFTLVNQIATEYSRRAAGAVNGHYEDLSDDQQFARKLVRDNFDAFKADMMERGLMRSFTTCEQDAKVIASCDSSDDWTQKLLENYLWIRASINTYRGKEDIGEVNPIVKAQLWKQQIASWEEISSQALDQVERTVENVNSSLFKKACPDKELRQKLYAWLQDDFHVATENARVELRRLIASERDGQLFSLHPTIVSKREQLRLNRINTILQECILKNSDASLPQVAAEPPLKVGKIASDLIIQSLLDRNPELVGVFNTHDSLAAYYEVALFRFIDNFALQVVERHLLGPQGPLLLFNSDYVSQKLYGEENATELNNLAGEDPGIVQKRLDLHAKQASLEESKKRVQGFKIL